MKRLSRQIAYGYKAPLPDSRHRIPIREAGVAENHG